MGDRLIHPFVFQIPFRRSRDLRVGIVSDTHGAMDPALAGIFKGCALILHLGDIGKPAILSELEKVAPVVAIRGNHEPQSLMDLPRLRSLDLEDVRVMLSHGLSSMDRGVARSMFPDFFRRLKDEGVRLLLFGHTHQAEAFEEDGVVFANPGLAGAADNGRTRSAAVLRLGEDHGTIEFHFLQGREP